MVGVIVESQLTCLTPTSLKHEKPIVQLNRESGDISNRDFGCEWISEPFKIITTGFAGELGGQRASRSAERHLLMARKDLGLGWETVTCIEKVRQVRTCRSSLQDHLFRGGRHDCLPSVHRWFAKSSATVINL
jgi:hypothetical protein